MNTFTVTIGGVDYSDEVIDNVNIYWGREDLYRQPDPATATVSVVRNPSSGAIDPTVFTIGAPVVITVYNGVSTLYRFQGEVTDLTANWYTIDIAAVSPLARTTAYAAEYTLAPLVDPGPVWDTLRPTGQAVDNLVSAFPGTPTVDAEPGELEVSYWYDQPDFIDWWGIVASIVAGEPFAVICEDMTPTAPNWTIRFTDATYRRNTTPDLTLTGSEVLLDWSIRKAVGDKVNYITTAVPAHPAGFWADSNLNWDQPTDTSTSQRYNGNLSPTFSPPEAVRNLATSMIGLWQQPEYRLRQVNIPMSTLTAARQNTIMGAVRMSNLIRIPEILPGFPTDYFLEGCRDTYADGKWVLTLFLSDTRLSHPPDRWDDVMPSLDWASVSPTMTWADAYKERF